MSLARAANIPDAVAAGGDRRRSREVPGRVEAVDAGQRFLVVVDYAHTPDSILHVLQAARPLTSGRLIVVFGCGGDRDRAKRPLMGQAATANADLTIITSDNPRTRGPLARSSPRSNRERSRVAASSVVEPDRRAAIRAAVREAGEGDTVVIAGKGHEDYQELADGTMRVRRSRGRARGAHGAPGGRVRPRRDVPRSRAPSTVCSRAPTSRSPRW